MRCRGVQPAGSAPLLLSPSPRRGRLLPSRSLPFPPLFRAVSSGGHQRGAREPPPAGSRAGSRGPGRPQPLSGRARAPREAAARGSPVGPGRSCPLLPLPAPPSGAAALRARPPPTGAAAMAETEERSLDDFFAKRDKKKRKEKSSRGAAAASGASSAASNAAGAAASAGGTRQADGSGSGAAASNTGSAKTVTKEEDDWKEFEQKEEVDYSGLRVQSMQISEKEDEESEKREEPGDNWEETGGGIDRSSGPWNKSAPAPAPVVEPIVTETPEPVHTGGVYRPPGAREGGRPRRAQQGPPEIYSDTQFPSLQSTAKLVDSRKDKEMEKSFEVVKHKTRGRDEVSKNQALKLQLDNQYAVLGDQ